MSIKEVNGIMARKGSLENDEEGNVSEFFPIETPKSTRKSTSGKKPENKGKRITNKQFQQKIILLIVLIALFFAIIFGVKLNQKDDSYNEKMVKEPISRTSENKLSNLDKTKNKVDAGENGFVISLVMFFLIVILALIAISTAKAKKSSKQYGNKVKGIVKNMKWDSEANEKILSFRVEVMDEDNNIQHIPVRLKSPYIKGSISNGDEVEVTGGITKYGITNPKKIFNADTNSIIGSSGKFWYVIMAVLIAALFVIFIIKNFY